MGKKVKKDRRRAGREQTLNKCRVHGYLGGYTLEPWSGGDLEVWRRRNLEVKVVGEGSGHHPQEGFCVRRLSQSLVI